MLHLFDTARGEVAPVAFRQEGRASMYVCGPTVYGPPHLGHGRMTLVFDVLRRYLEWCGLEVTHVSNITDIDDQIINRAAREGRTEAEVAAECEAEWYSAMDRMGVLRPVEDPHATAWVDQMVELVADLVDRGAAYETGDGVYLDTAAVDGYGLLARQTLDSLRSGARIEVDDEKRSPLDFVLWKKAKPGEPTWPSPFGDGRPGWHTECVVMSLGLLGESFDIHGGGQDLAFPHHENERAQAVAQGRPFARHWVHNGFVEVDGEKMSKSLGNFTNLDDLLDSTDARAYRLLVLRAHYRSPLEVSVGTTSDAAAALSRFDALSRRMEALSPSPASSSPDGAEIQRFQAAMDDDLNTPAVVDQLFTLIRAANTALDDDDADRARVLWSTATEIAAAVGLEPSAVTAVPADIEARVAERDEARAAGDYEHADRLRDELATEGWSVVDTPDGGRAEPV